MTDKEIEAFTIEIKKTELVKKTANFLSELWNNYQNEFKYSFGLRLFEYAQRKHFNCTTHILPKNERARKEIIKIYGKRKGSALSSTKQHLRLAFGYDSLTLDLVPKRCNLSSEKANTHYKEKTEKDYIVGARLCSEYVLNVFLKDTKWNKEIWVNLDWLDTSIHYMCNDWLEDHLWLWTQCRITRNEYIAKNVILSSRVKESIFEELLYRVDLEHYKEANIVVASDYKNIII